MSRAGYLLLEISTLALFTLTWWHATRRSARLELLSAALFGILLEIGQMAIFRTYHYSDQFWFAIGPVPLVIGLCWGIIIYGAMAYSDQLGLVAGAAPFADALWALLLDLSFDAIAVRLGFWTWAIPLEAGYFGVPAENFIGWIAVALGFSAYTRVIRRVGDRRQRAVLQLCAPLVAYAALWLATLGFRAILALRGGADAADGSGMSIVVALMITFATIVVVAMRRGRVAAQRGIDLIPTIGRWSMHGYYLGWALLLLIAPSLQLPGMDMPPFLIGMALALLGIETLMLLPLLSRDASLARQVRIAPVMTPGVARTLGSATLTSGQRME